ncbi:MAG: glutaredoxin domain-containing protein [Gammaproteobacteria bacterium]|nr:glutaredoxin domain-containing protein [Gammaproteobacteria bacterium]
MQRTQIYFKDWCSYSQRALELLRHKGVDFDAIDVTNDVDRELEMRDRAGRTSVPQIFVGDRHLGGYDDIAALDRGGELDAILEHAVDKAA